MYINSAPTIFVKFLQYAGGFGGNKENLLKTMYNMYKLQVI